MKMPGPDHPITLTLHPRAVRVSFGGKVIAETKRALALRESTYPPVFYIPREDVQMALFERTANASHCPYKGQASYYTAIVEGKRSENAAWSYETPFEHMAEIKNCLAFYPGRVDKIEEFA